MAAVAALLACDGQRASAPEGVAAGPGSPVADVRIELARERAGRPTPHPGALLRFTLTPPEDLTERAGVALRARCQGGAAVLTDEATLAVVGADPGDRRPMSLSHPLFGGAPAPRPLRCDVVFELVAGPDDAVVRPLGRACAAVPEDEGPCPEVPLVPMVPARPPPRDAAPVTVHDPLLKRVQVPDGAGGGGHEVRVTFTVAATTPVAGPPAEALTLRGICEDGERWVDAVPVPLDPLEAGAGRRVQAALFRRAPLGLAPARCELWWSWEAAAGSAGPVLARACADGDAVEPGPCPSWAGPDPEPRAPAAPPVELADVAVVFLDLAPSDARSPKAVELRYTMRGRGSLGLRAPVRVHSACATDGETHVDQVPLGGPLDALEPGLSLRVRSALHRVVPLPRRPDRCTFELEEAAGSRKRLLARLCWDDRLGGVVGCGEASVD